MISEMLGHGAGAAVTASYLCGILDIDARELREVIHRERVNGAVILAGNEGLYLPSSDPVEALREIRAFERRMKAKARNTLKATESATRERARLEQQKG